jgi:hypothetical protein
MALNFLNVEIAEADLWRILPDLIKAWSRSRTSGSANDETQNNRVGSTTMLCRPNRLEMWA